MEEQYDLMKKRIQYMYENANQSWLEIAAGIRELSGYGEPGRICIRDVPAMTGT